MSDKYVTAKKIDMFTSSDLSRIIEMAWEDRTPFEAIEQLYDLNETQVIHLMRTTLKRKSFQNWRRRVSGRKSKHLLLRSCDITRAYCPSQYKVKSATKAKR